MGFLGSDLTIKQLNIFEGGMSGHVSGNEQEQRGDRRLIEARLLLETVITAVEQVKGQKWDEFREKHGDRGRDMVLYLGQRVSAPNKSGGNRFVIC